MADRRNVPIIIDQQHGELISKKTYRNKLKNFIHNQYWRTKV